MEPLRLCSPFHYLVILDFEATCDEGVNPLVTRENQEIIEFPWVVFEVASGQIVDKAQIYVKPEWSRQLTPFCTKLTHITNEMVMNLGVPLREAVQRFDHYVYTRFIANNRSFCLLTDGDWDLQFCLLRETMAKGIPLAPYYRHFFNLREEFSKLHRSCHVTSLRSMLNYIGASIEGRHHSGIDDCMSISKIVQHMAGLGYYFDIPNVIPDHFDPSTVDYRDFSSTMRFEQIDSGREGVVRIRGIPWQTTESDIRNFFAPLKIVERGILLGTNYMGRLSGEAHVKFYDEKDGLLALQYDKREMGHRYIEVFRSSGDEMNHARGKILGRDIIENSGQGETEGYIGVIRMRGLPFSVTIEDILNFFEGFSLVPSSVQIVSRFDGKVTGEAYVEFTSESEAQRAYQSKNNQYMGSRYIELFRCDKDELLMHQTEMKKRETRHVHVHSAEVGYIVRMRGLPYSTTEREIMNFFGGLGIVNNGIHLMYDGAGRPTGEAYVELLSHREMNDALAMDRNLMGTRYIEVFKATRDELMMALPTPTHQQQIPYTAPPSQVYQSPMVIPSYTGGYNNDDNNFPNNNNNNSNNNNYPPTNSYSHSSGNFSHNNNNNNNNSYSGSSSSTHHQKGTILRLRGIPFHASIADIEMFFMGYNFIPQSIQLGKNRDGRKSGEAWITFASNQEAMRALKERDKQYMNQRYIELFVDN